MDIDARCCDARHGLASLSDESVDMIFTDPPYRTISGGSGKAGDGSPRGVIGMNDGKIFQHNDIDVTEYAAELYRVLTSPGHCYVMCNVLNLWSFQRVFTDVGFKVHNLLVWKKNNVVVSRFGGKNGEYVLFLRKGPARTIYEYFKTVEDCDNVRGRTHPTEKPVDLISRYILASSLPGQTVLDPFMGTGSAGEAATHHGRKFIGFEIDADYYESACRRLKVIPYLPPSVPS